MLILSDCDYPTITDIQGLSDRIATSLTIEEDQYSDISDSGDLSPRVPTDWAAVGQEALRKQQLQVPLHLPGARDISATARASKFHIYQTVPISHLLFRF